MSLHELTLETFEPLIGDAFGIAAEPEGVELVLDAADALGELAGGRRPFSLTFRGPPEPILPQATYPFEHAALGTLEIFIVPIGRDADATSYEAIFT